MIKVAIATLGCKTNAYESAAIIGGFDPKTHMLVPFEDSADIYIINTCTVTNRTDFKSRNLIRKALARKEQDPSVKVVVTGCFAQRNPGEVLGLGSIDLLADNQSKLDISALTADSDYEFRDISGAREFAYRPVHRMVERSRAFQKIQDGCDFRCNYCAIPDARGSNRSAAFTDVLDQARLFVASGYKEIVLGGVNLGLYRDNDRGLAEVVEVLQDLSGLELIRLSSLEPQLLTPAMLTRLRECAKLCPHFHIPLQAGSDSVLRRMGRRYETSQFRTTIECILERFPDAAIGLDVIAGFPGESVSEFEQTLTFVTNLGVCYIHAFSFSKRPGTPAYTMNQQISNLEKNRRVKLLTALSDEKRRQYIDKLLISEISLRGVCESVEAGIASCLSDHYIRAYTGQDSSLGDVLQIKPQRAYRDGVLGTDTV